MRLISDPNMLSGVAIYVCVDLPQYHHFLISDLSCCLSRDSIIKIDKN